MFDFDFSVIGDVIIAIVVILVIVLLLSSTFFVVKQQHAYIIERLGRFNRIVGAGFHVKIPFIETVAQDIPLRTLKNAFTIDAKTEDNVTIGLAVSAQYHVDYAKGSSPQDSGVYRSYYMLENPVNQMQDFITDALRSAIPSYSLDEVFSKKDDIAKDVNATVSEKMTEYGFVLVSTLITSINLPKTVEDSMNEINSAQRKRLAAQDLAEADRIKKVTEAKAEAESMEKAGEGIANQRKAIALGIKDSLDTIKESGVSPQEANELFMFTQWTDMMGKFAESGKGSTVVLPSDFQSASSVFEQMLVAGDANDIRNEGIAGQ